MNNFGGQKDFRAFGGVSIKKGMRGIDIQKEDITKKKKGKRGDDKQTNK